MARSPNHDLNPKRIEILRIIHRFHEKGYSPTLQEIADERGTTRVSVHEFVQPMIRDGWLARGESWSRALSLTEASEQWLAAHPVLTKT